MRQSTDKNISSDNARRTGAQILNDDDNITASDVIKSERCAVDMRTYRRLTSWAAEERKTVCEKQNEILGYFVTQRELERGCLD